MKRIALFAALLGLAAPASGAAPEPAETGSEAFVTIPEISVPIVDAGRMDGVLRVSIVLQTHDIAAANRLSAQMPDLQAAGLSAAVEFARLYASPYTPVDVEKLSAELAPALVHGDAGVRKLLIVNVTAMAA